MRALPFSSRHYADVWPSVWCFGTARPIAARGQQPGHDLDVNDVCGAIRLWLDPQLIRAGEHSFAATAAAA
jgi:hypothetical protein